MHVKATILIQFCSLCWTSKKSKMDIGELRADTDLFAKRSRAALFMYNLG